MDYKDEFKLKEALEWFIIFINKFKFKWMCFNQRKFLNRMIL